MSTNECYIPLLTLLSNNFNLVRGSIITVRVAATNSIGTSQYTTTDGVLVETVPQKPDPVLIGDETNDL